jgi:hypothetical protein|tara:strand:- start:620 stop:799 length:180 start_codon:yes stop_codon:yes gene_type:complete
MEIKELHTYMKEEFAEIKELQKVTNGRIGSLERWRAFITGGMIVIGTVGGALIGVLAFL